MPSTVLDELRNREFEAFRSQVRAQNRLLQAYELLSLALDQEKTALEATVEAERTVGEVHKAILAHNRADRGPSRSRSRSRRGATATAESFRGNASSRCEEGSVLVDAAMPVDWWKRSNWRDQIERIALRVRQGKEEIDGGERPSEGSSQAFPREQSSAPPPQLLCTGKNKSMVV